MLTMEERVYFIRLIREEAGMAPQPQGTRAPAATPMRPAPKEPPRTPPAEMAARKTP